MSPGPPPPGRPFAPARLEWALALLLLTALAFQAVVFARQGYLPQPFFFDVTDPLMDLYSTAYWAHQRGAYSAWNSVYPPLSFVFLRLVSLPGCYLQDPFWSRDCDWLVRYVLYALFIVNVGILFLSFRRSDPSTAWPRAIALGLGLPMLYGFERGNLVVPCFTAFALAFGRILPHARRRVAALAVAINFKPYLLVAVLPRLARRHLRWLAALGAWVGGIYLATYLAYGHGTPAELAHNARVFSAVTGESFWEKIYYATSYAPLLRFTASDFPLLQHVDSRIVEHVAPVLAGLMWLGLAITAAIHAVAVLGRGRLASHRLTAALLCLLMVMSESSGPYALVFPLFLIFEDRWHGVAGGIVLACAYLLCLPVDHVLLPVFHGAGQAWWSGREVYAEFGVAVGQFLRPLLLIVILYGLAWMNGRDLLLRRAEPVPASA